MNYFAYSRHFALLAGFSLLMVATSGLHLSGNISVSFAAYGALHAGALVFGLRSRPALWRKCLFMAVGAILSVVAVRVAITASRLAGVFPANAGFYWPLGLSAATGAATYGLAIRLLWVKTMSFAVLAAIVVASTSATCAAGFTLRHFHFLGLWWLAVVWWHAFSGGLWYFDRPHTSGAGRSIVGARG